MGTGRISHMIHLQGSQTAPSTVACASKSRGAVRPRRRASCDPLLCLLRTPLNEANQHYFPFITSMTSSSAFFSSFLLLSPGIIEEELPAPCTTSSHHAALSESAYCVPSLHECCWMPVLRAHGPEGAGPHHPFTQSFDSMHRCAWAPGQTLDI